MNNFEIEHILKHYPVSVCCADELPAYTTERPRTFVVNTDTCDRAGSHCTGFHFPEKGPCEFFDSLGNYPETYQPRFKGVLSNNGPSYKFRKDRVLSEFSDVCGQYYIYFIVQRWSGRCLEDIFNDFNIYKHKNNDRFVREFVEHLK